MPGDGPALPMISDIELLGIIRVVCETIDNKPTKRKFDLQTRHVAGSQNCKTNMDPQAKLDEGSTSKDKTSMADYLNSRKSKTNMSEHFISSNNKETDKRASEAITNRIHNTFNIVFSGIGCFEGMFSLKVKDGSHQYQASPRRVACALQKAVKEQLQWLQEQQINAL